MTSTHGWRARITPDLLRYVLGGIWVLDGIFNFQPQMYSQFASGVIAPNAEGQPGFISYSINHLASFLARDVGLWTVLFGLLQIGIGAGLWWRRTVREALVASFVFTAGVWWAGEGFGGLFNGQASPLMGAPGAVLIYALIGVLIWPRREGGAPVSTAPEARVGTAPEDTVPEARVGIASAAGGRGPFGTGLLVWGWAGFWLLSALLWMLPVNRAPGAIHDQIESMVAGEPSWYGHFLSSMAHAFVGTGTVVAVVMVALSVVVAAGPLLSRRPEPFIVLGCGLALVFWVTGEAVGGIFTGMATDPEIGPLVVLLGLALWPTVPVSAGAPFMVAGETRATAVGQLGRRPAALVLLAAALVAGPAAVAAVPLSKAADGAPATSGTSSSSTSGTASSDSMSGMSMSGGSMSGMSMSGSTGTTSAKAKGSKASKGSKAGPGMDMSDAAGLGVSDPTWTYTGTPLPADEVQLLTTVSNETDEGHQMQTPDCSTSPTDQQVLGAMEYVQATSAAVAKYKLLSAAVAAGYRPVTSTAYPVVHYVDPALLSAKNALDPNHVDSLVYAFTPNGPVLVAAMYLMPRAGQDGPMPYGCLVQWHAHTNLCYSESTGVIVGFTPCTSGTFNEPTGMMTHVWQVPVAGGPLALDPSDLQVVEAAIMAQDEGLAPITSSSGQVSYETASAATVGTF